MKVLHTAYAINPYKGSEDGMGWNFVTQAARFNQVIAITRENNQQPIEKFMTENPSKIYQNLKFEYFDLPYYLRFWKKGSRFSLLYFYLWQIGVVFAILKRKLKTDLHHNLNFHNDWAPTFLWLLKKPLVWGPIGHHPPIPKNYIRPIYGVKAYLIDQLKFITKNIFWYLDPFLWMSRLRAKKILYMNTVSANKVNIKKDDKIIFPSVGSEDVVNIKIKNEYFDIISIGRFIPLKGFDLSIESFRKFFKRLSDEDKKKARLIIIGQGEEEQKLRKMISDFKLDSVIVVKNWMDREQLATIYASASVFLFPSHEGAGMVVSEAMSYGLPVVCFDNAGPGEFVNSDSGIKIPYSDYEQSTTEFADHLQTLFHKPDVRKILSIGARNRFMKMFNWNVKGEILNEIYNSTFINKKYK